MRKGKNQTFKYTERYFLGLQKWKHQYFFISRSPKLCNFLLNLILFDCMQLEKLFCADQDLLDELKRFLAECKGPTLFPNVPASTFF